MYLGIDLVLVDDVQLVVARSERRSARLARLAVTGEAVATVCTAPQRIEIFVPDPALAAAWAERRPHWRSLCRPR